MLRLGNRIRLASNELEDLQQTVKCRVNPSTVEEYNQVLDEAAYFWNDECNLEMVEFCLSLKLKGHR